MKTIINVFNRDPEKQPRYFVQAVQEVDGVQRELFRGTANDRGVAELSLAFSRMGVGLNYQNGPAPE